VNINSLEIGSGSLFQGITQVMTDRVCERHMRRDASAEKGRCALARSIKELIREDNVHWLKLFAQRSNGARRYYPLNAEQFHRIDVRAEWNLCRQEGVASPVSRQESDAHAAEISYDERVRRITKRGADTHFFNVRERSHLVKPASTDYPNLHL
jgi:hypothetical protein